MFDGTAEKYKIRFECSICGCIWVEDAPKDVITGLTLKYKTCPDCKENIILSSIYNDSEKRKGKEQMKYIISEIIIPRTEGNAEIFAPQRIRVRVENVGAGNRLAVEGINDEFELGNAETAHEMYFDNEEEINDFARICKNILNPVNSSIHPPLLNPSYQPKTAWESEKERFTVDRRNL